MKKFRIVILAFSFYFLYASNAFSTLQMVDRIAAIVNNDVILESEINAVMHPMIKNNSHHQLPDHHVMLRRQILDRLIMDHIILQIAQHDNIIISDEQIDQALQEIAAQHYMTLDQFRRHCLIDEEIDYDIYRSNIRKEIIMAEVCNYEIRQRVTVFPKEVESFVKQISEELNNRTEINLSHILIPISDEQPNSQINHEAEALAQSLLVEARENRTDFDKLAVTYSSDIQGLKVGPMGWNKLEDLPTLFSDRLSYVQKGSIIGPIRSAIGLHILKVNEIRSNAQRLMVTEVHARHIFLRSSINRSDHQAYITLLDIAKRIRSGDITFPDAVKEISEDLNSIRKGGDLGWIPIEAFDSTFHHAIPLRHGEISTPVRSSHGWHLIQIINTRQIDSTDTAQKEHAYRLLFNRKFSEAFQTWMQEQRVAAYVNILNNDG